MSYWTVHPRRNPPPEDILVEVRGSDYLGEWYGVAIRKDYKPGASKAQLKRKWRWCAVDGAPFEEDINAWRYRSKEGA